MAVVPDFVVKNTTFALLLEEIRCQPNLQNELGANEFGEVCAKALGQTLVVIIATMGEPITGVPIWVARCLGPKIIDTLTPPPTSIFRSIADTLAMRSGSNYDSLCRSALLHLFWRQYSQAEMKLNIAKNNHDDRAFSHHVYGLLRGLQGNVEEAKFELGLARARETHESAIKRIDLALKVLDFTSRELKDGHGEAE